MPVCTKCGKESNNLRMCPFCHAPYPRQEGETRQSITAAARRRTGSTPRATSAVRAKARPAAGGATPGLSPLVKYGMPALIVAFLLWYFVLGAERKIPAGTVMPDIVAIPMTRFQAEAILARMKDATTAGTGGSDVAVTIPRASWPERRAGQLALAQQYARADEIVSGRRRTISFFDPGGSLYAKADAAGVVMVR